MAIYTFVKKSKQSSKFNDFAIMCDFLTKLDRSDLSMQQFFFKICIGMALKPGYLTRPDFDTSTECDAVLGEEVNLQRLDGKLQSIVQRSHSDINS